METKEDKLVKESLRKSADSFKASLEHEIGESMVELEKAAKIAAAVGGGLLLGYSIYKIFFEKEETPKKKKGWKGKKGKKGMYEESLMSSIFRPIVAAGAEVASQYLLAMAKQKLEAYLQELTEGHTISDEHSE